MFELFSFNIHLVEVLMGFKLAAGSVITIPNPGKLVIRHSKNARDNRDTPRVIKLKEVHPELYDFLRTSEIGGRTNKKTFFLFVPKGLKRGDRLRVSWFEGKCACADQIVPVRRDEKATARETEPVLA